MDCDFFSQWSIYFSILLYSVTGLHKYTHINDAPSLNWYYASIPQSKQQQIYNWLKNIIFQPRFTIKLHWMLKQIRWNWNLQCIRVSIDDFSLCNFISMTWNISAFLTRIFFTLQFIVNIRNKHKNYSIFSEIVFKN